MPISAVQWTAATKLALCTLLVACGRSPAPAAPEGRAEPDPALRAFLTERFGGISGATLRTNALPYKVVATALVMAEEERTGRSLDLSALPEILTRFGFIHPDRVEGWPVSIERPGGDAPLGLLRGTVRGPLPGIRVEGATLGCAACHTGVTYDSAGYPTRHAWPGLPNTSMNVDAYVMAAYRGLQRADSDQGAFRERVQALFPGISVRERITMRFVLQPAIRKRLAELRRAGDRPTPFSNGGPGRTNGVASLQRQLGLLGDGVAAPHAVGFTSIPDLAGRGLRTSLLYDGVYAPGPAARFTPMQAGELTSAHVDSLAAVVAFFTVPTMGVSPEVAEVGIPKMRPIMEWLARRYAPPPFPGPVDGSLASEGESVYVASCAGCHGRHAPGPAPRPLTWFPNRPVPQHEMATDPARWAMVDSTFVRAIEMTGFARHMSVSRTGGYVAPILSGVWATAPYLHNGSVPTLWSLLTPSARPVTFPVGGHRLDFRDVGIALTVDASGAASYPPGYRPWSVPETYDTRLPGLSNRGHEQYSVHLSDREKRAVIEYLKLL